MKMRKIGPKTEILADCDARLAAGQKPVEISRGEWERTGDNQFRSMVTIRWQWPPARRHGILTFE